MSARRPAQGSPAKEVQVDMIHRLSGCRSTIENGPVPLCKPFFRGQLPRHRDKVSDQFFIRFGEVVQLRNGFSRNDQDMYGCLGSDVPECETLFVLIHHIGRNVSIRYFLKKRSCIGHVAWKRQIARNIFYRRLFSRLLVFGNACLIEYKRTSDRLQREREIGACPVAILAAIPAAMSPAIVSDGMKSDFLWRLFT